MATQSIPLIESPTESVSAVTERALIDRWMSTSPEVRAMRSQVSVERWELVTAGLLPNPSVELGVNLLVAGTPPDGVYNGGVQVSLPVLLSGQRDARRAAARAGIAVAEAEFSATLWERVNELHGHALDCAWAEARRVLFETALAELASVETIARSRGGAGQATTYDIGRIATAMASLRAELDATALERDRAEAALAAAVGTSATNGTRITREGLRGVNLPDTLTALEALAMTERPDLVRARLEVRRHGADSDRERADGRPVPSFFLGSYVTAVAGSLSVNGGVSVPLPVFDRNQGRVGRAMAERDAAQWRLQALEARVQAEVRGAWRIRTNAREALARFERSGVAATTELLEQARRAWQAGAFNIAELIDAYNAELDAREQALRLSRNVADADAALARSVGRFESQ